MPALPAVPKVIKLLLYNAALDASKLLINRLFVRYSGTAPTNSDLDTFTGDINTAYGTNLCPLEGAAYTYGGCSAEDLSSSTSAVSTNPDSVVGTRSGNTLGGQVNTVISLEIARRYRGGHPRNYWPFGTDSDVNDELTWSSSYLTTVGAAFASFLTGLEAAGWSGAGTVEVVNVSFYDGFTNHTYPSGRTRPIPTLRGTPLIDTVSSYIVRRSLGTQRRRIAFAD